MEDIVVTEIDELLDDDVLEEDDIVVIELGVLEDEDEDADGDDDDDDEDEEEVLVVGGTVVEDLGANVALTVRADSDQYPTLQCLHRI